MTDLDTYWPEILDVVRQKVAKQTFNTWLTAPLMNPELGPEMGPLVDPWKWIVPTIFSWTGSANTI